MAAFLEVEEAVEGAVEAASDGVFVAIEAVEEPGIAGERSECLGQASGGIGFAGFHLTAECRGFDGPRALFAPFGHDHAMYQVALGGTDWLVLVHVFFEEFVEALLGFAGEQGPGGGEAVAEGVHGGYGFACGCRGASRFGAVEAGALEFSARCVLRHSLISGLRVAGCQGVWRRRFL
jgi:hypothetical protein